jgi:cytoskeletal protein RodZ
MKWIKIYLVVVTLLLVGAIGAGVYVWFKVQALSDSLQIEATTPTKVGETMPTDTNTSATQKSEVSKKETKPSETPKQNTPSTDTSKVTEPIVVDTTNLSDTQRTLLKSLGITESTITITPEMITCAENAVGAQRLAEITAGDAPSAFESVKLLPCFKK